MGAKQRAQKRGKASRGSQKGTPTSQKKLNSSIHVPDLSHSTRRDALLGWQDFALTSSPPDRKGFTMGDTARNTERHMFGWGSSRLRDQGINFVNAGTLHQDPLHIKATDEQDQHDEPFGHRTQYQETESNVAPDNASPPKIKVEQVSPPGRVLEEAISKPASTSFRPRSPSSTSMSSSSEAEQIVFRGRSKGPTPKIASVIGSRKGSRVQSAVRDDTIMEEKISSMKISETLVDPVPTRKKPGIVDVGASSSDQRSKNSRLRKRGRGRRRQSDIDEQEAIMRDYIANMVMDDSDESESELQPQQSTQQGQSFKTRRNETIRFYDGSGEENMKVQIQSAKTPSRKFAKQAIDWNSDDLHDFDDLSTSDEEIVEISQVLRHRQRRSGPQYLVTPSGCENSDAKWILHEKLVSQSAQNEIAIFEEIQAMAFEESFDDEDDDEDDEGDEGTTDEEVQQALNDLIDHIESEDDENARIMKHTARMTDEQIARALAKQEELGMGGDELVLFSGDINDDDNDIDKHPDPGMDDAFGRNDDFISFSLQQHTSNRTRSRRNKKNRDSFPSAAAFADALDQDPYGGFDIMDFDRPSLRPKKKGRKSDFPYDLELEDDDLRDHLVATWMNDRDKKAQRKKEKEEARQAVLFEIADRSDPAAIKAEIRRFLLQEVDVLRLSPMESATRASVHRLAKALQLKSHSEGKEGVGKGRYPVLTKTPRTPSYTIDTVWEIDALLNTRKFFPKNAGSYKKDKLPRGLARTGKTRRSGGVEGASYMNGEIVGASAPEIGAENRGRAMLEKMGWTTGMAIGAEGNKGSLEAVKHVFKTSRAGLG